MVTRFLRISLGVVVMLSFVCGCASDDRRSRSALFKDHLDRYTQVNQLEILAENLENVQLRVNCKVEQLRSEHGDSAQSNEAIVTIWMKLLTLEGRVDRAVSGYRQELISLRTLYKPANWSEVSSTVEAQIDQAKRLYQEVINALAEANRVLERLRERSTPPRRPPPLRFRSYFAQVRAQDESPVLTYILDAKQVKTAATIMPLVAIFVSEKNLFWLLG